MFESIAGAFKSAWAWVKGQRQRELEQQHAKNLAAAQAEVDAAIKANGSKKP